MCNVVIIIVRKQSEPPTISHRKGLIKGDYLIDDRKKNGAGKFEGELILFGSERFGW